MMPIFLILFSFPLALFASLHVSTHSEAALLINPDSGAILYEKNSTTPLYPASMTKVATALYALKLKPNDLDTPIQASAEAVGSITEEAKKRSNYTISSWWLVPGSSHIGIKKGEILTFKDLIYGMLIASGDDAANVIAEFAGGSIPEFMKGLNIYLKSIGCKDSHFTNPHGLFHPDQKTTCHDMAVMMKEALKIPFFSKVINTPVYTRPQTNKQAPVTLVQTNRLLRPGAFYYPKTIGGKTGHIQAAQNTFVVAAKNNDRTLIAVFMKTKERSDLWRDSIKLFETAFNEPLQEKIFLKKGDQKYILKEPNFEQNLTTYTLEDARLSYYPSEEQKVKGLIFWESLELPVAKDQKVGEIRLVNVKGENLKIVPLYSKTDIKGTWTFKLKNSLGFITHTGWGLALLLGVLLGAGFLLIKRFIM